MNNQSYEVIKPNINNTKNALKGKDIYYRCTKCQSIIPSMPKTSTNCTCGNIGIDADLIRLFVEDFSQFEILRKKKLVKHILPFIKRILYYFGLLSAFFFVIWIWPNAASTFSIIVVIACIGIIVFPLIRGNYRLYKKGEYSKSVYLRKTIMDTVGILIIGLFVLLIASALAKDIGQKVGKAVETYTPGLGIPAGIFSGLITAVLVGLCVGYIVRMIWIPITKIIMGSKQTDQ